ncbi:helix-turn-helix domain-containing protein [Vibrio mimicus]
MNNSKILPFDYVKGREFTEILKEVTGCSTLGDMAELFDVPKATFSTWNLHNRTSHELMVRLHLAMGIPIAKMALGIDEPEKHQVSDAHQDYAHYQKKLINPQHETVILTSFCLTNGQLIETGEIPYPVRRMNSFNLKAESTIEVETNEAIYLVDNSSCDAVSGNYLIDIDGRLSVNHIQRLPGKKLVIAFSENSIEVSEHDIKVLGRVAVTLRKD